MFNQVSHSCGCFGKECKTRYILGLVGEADIHLSEWAVQVLPGLHKTPAHFQTPSQDRKNIQHTLFSHHRALQITGRQPALPWTTTTNTILVSTTPTPRIQATPHPSKVFSLTDPILCSCSQIPHSFCDPCIAKVMPQTPSSGWFQSASHGGGGWGGGGRYCCPLRTVHWHTTLTGCHIAPAFVTCHHPQTSVA